MEVNSPATTSTPETDSETPPTQHLCKTLSFPNGSLHHHHYSPPPPVVVLYKECLKNHAAALGGRALDGCGEFMPAPTATTADPTSLKCAACGCHRNFHRRDPPSHTHLIEYHPYSQIGTHGVASPNSIYCSSAPQMLLALSNGGGVSDQKASMRKRYRTKFSQEQKEKMYLFSEKLGWKMQKRDQGLVEEFCNEVGVGKGVFKVWMHNNKHTFGKTDPHLSSNTTAAHFHTHYNNNTHLGLKSSSSS